MREFYLSPSQYNRVAERLYNCLRNEIYITCSMYDEFESLEDEKKVDR